MSVNKFILVLGIYTLGLVGQVQADVLCPAGKVNMLYRTEERAFIQIEGQGWQLLGFANDEQTPTKMMIAQNAKQKGESVQLSFADGYDCLTYDDNNAALQIQVLERETF
ncbi:hypothetical protein GCM10009092_01170 [Bowmanella denitrificans]|uniref:Uncharacterized protein n=1 Tax=Bowmanella denitrificans TaxID=366582 RepID=A0ABP3G9Z3_9ALTE